MKIADVTYTGNMRTMRTTGASGEVYRFKNPLGGDPRPINLESIEEAKYFERKGDVYEVEWTVLGLLAKSAKPPVDALTDLGYRQKQKIAKRFDVKANQKEDELEEELKPYVEELENQI